ncbi:MAG: DUF3368 domain-containing protein [Chloroflexi bacterium]|nr:DUF3368 domain-containing protein [Chloroflexota bacterium]
MIVVSNTSPLTNLAAIGQPELLRRLFGTVFIPEAVLEELCLAGLEGLEDKESPKLPWLETHSVSNRTLVQSLLLELDKGEAEAIALAVELKADLLLLDERLARRVASRLGLRFVGLLGLLLEAKHRGFIVGVKPVLDALTAKAGFWVGRELYARVLEAAGE